MRWPPPMRSLTAKDEEDARPEDDEGLRCDTCGTRIADKVLSTAGVRPSSTTCKSCSNASYVGSRRDAIGA